MTNPQGNACRLDITPLEERPPPRQRSRANLAAVDQRFDMGRVYCVVAVLANQHHRFCCGHPVVAHDGILPLSVQHPHMFQVSMVVDGELVERQEKNAHQRIGGAIPTIRHLFHAHPSIILYFYSFVYTLNFLLYFYG